MKNTIQFKIALYSSYAVLLAGLAGIFYFASTQVPFFADNLLK